MRGQNRIPWFNRQTGLLIGGAISVTSSIIGLLINYYQNLITAKSKRTRSLSKVIN